MFEEEEEKKGPKPGFHNLHMLKKKKGKVYQNWLRQKEEQDE